MNTLNIVLIFLFSVNVNATELGDGSNSQSETNVSSDLSNLPVRKDINKCSAKALEQRQKKQDLCFTRFKEIGVEQAIEPHEIIQARSCEKIEKTSEYLSGCGDFIKAIPGETLEGIQAIFGIGKFDDEIKNSCGERPRYPAATLGRRRTRGGLTAKQRAAVSEYRRKDNSFTRCKNKIIKEQTAIEVANADKIKSFKKTCQSQVKGRAQKRRLARTGLPHIIGPCMIKLAESSGCDACVKELSKIPFGTALIESTLESLRKYKGFSCYNKKTQGEMACAAIATAVGIPFAGAGATKLASLASKIPKAFDKATDVASAQKKATEGLSKTTESVLGNSIVQQNIKLSDLPAVKNGKVTVYELKVNGVLEDVERLVRATDELKKIGKDTLTPEQSSAVLKAHNVGSKRGAGFGQYTKAERTEKRNILRNVGFSKDEVDLLMDKGYAGFLSTGNIRKPTKGSRGFVRPQGYKSQYTDYDIDDNLIRLKGYEKTLKNDPKTPNNARLLGESIAVDNLMKSGNEITPEVQSLFKRELDNNLELLDKPISETKLPYSVDSKNIVDAYVDYAATLPNGAQRQQQISKALEYKLKASKRLDATDYAEYFKSLRSYHDSAKSTFSKERIKAELELMHEVAKSNGWGMNYFGLPR